MTDETLRIIEPDENLKSEFYRYCEAFRSVNEPPRFMEQLAYQDFSAYIKKLQAASAGIEIPSDYVPATTYWLIREDKTILGNSSLRHRLTQRLEDFGGHIGYAIHPFERRKGYGTVLLRLTLEKAREKGISKVLITCDSDNIGSARVILENGGKLASQGTSTQTDKLISRYWIEITA
jgi:predicted acetyltransferase